MPLISLMPFRDYPLVACFQHSFWEVDIWSWRIFLIHYQSLRERFSCWRIYIMALRNCSLLCCAYRLFNISIVFITTSRPAANRQVVLVSRYNLNRIGGILVVVDPTRMKASKIWMGWRKPQGERVFSQPFYTSNSALVPKLPPTLPPYLQMHEANTPIQLKVLMWIHLKNVHFNFYHW